MPPGHRPRLLQSCHRPREYMSVQSLLVLPHHHPASTAGGDIDLVLLRRVARDSEIRAEHSAGVGNAGGIDILLRGTLEALVGHQIAAGIGVSGNRRFSEEPAG